MLTGWCKRLRVFLLCHICFKASADLHGNIQGYSGSGTAKFVYYTSQLTWNDARTVCQQNGGDLATIETSDLLQIVLHLLEERTESGVLLGTFWIGLIEDNYGYARWVFDCSRLLDTASYDLTSRVYQHCYVRDYGHDGTGSVDRCNRTRPFLCRLQTSFTDDTCEIETVLTSEIIYKYPASYNSCKTYCKQTDACTDVLFMGTESCYIMAAKPLGGSVLIASKLCAKVELNTTDILLVPSDNLIQPKHTCSNLPEYSSDIYSSQYGSSWSSSSSFTDPTIVCPTSTNTVTKTLYSPVKETCTVTMSVVHSIPSATYEMSSAYITPTASSSTERKNITEIEEITSKLVRNLTINVKSTSAFMRKNKSAEDKRKSSAAMGFVGLVCVLFPVFLIVLSDMKLMYAHVKEKQLPTATSYGIRKTLRRFT